MRLCETKNYRDPEVTNTGYTLKVGEHVYNPKDGCVDIIAQVDCMRVAAIALGDGNRFKNSVAVRDVRAINREEAEKILGNIFNLVEIVGY